MIGRLILVFIAWRIARRLLLAAVLIALVVAAIGALRESRTHPGRHDGPMIQRLLAPVEHDIARAIRSSR